MKKACGIVLFLLCFAFTANAAVRIGLAPGYALGGKLVADDADSTFDGAFSLGFGVGFDLMQYVSLELRGSWAGHNVAGSLSGLSKGKLTVIPVEAVLVGRFPISGKFFPYLFAGGGYSLNSFTVDSALAGDWSDAGFTLAESIKGAVSFSFGAGLDIALAKNILINVEGRMIMSKADGEWSLTEDASGEVASETLAGLVLNKFVFGLGLKYQF